MSLAYEKRHLPTPLLFHKRIGGGSAAAVVNQVVWLSGSAVNYEARTDTEIIAPGIIVDGGKLFTTFLIGGFGAIPVITPPLGFNEILTAPYPISVSSGGFTVETHLYWKNALAEVGNYTFVHANANTTAYMFATSVADPAAPVATGATDLVDPPDPTAPSLITAADGALVALFGQSFNFLGGVVAPGPPPVFTDRLNSILSILYMATGEMPVAGATGNKTVGLTENTSAAGLIAIEPV